MTTPRHLKIQRKAFSLVEVTMALGIFSFALMGLLGLIPAAVTTHREAKLDTVLTQIKQRLAAEVLLTDGAELQALNNFTRAFDVEGREIEIGDSDAAARTVYRGKIVLQNFQTPGGHSSDSLQRVVLYAVHDPTSGGELLDKARPSGSMLVPKAETAPSNASASAAGF